MSVKALYHTKHLPDDGIELPSSVRFVLFLIADFANEDGEAWPNYATLEHYSGLGRSTVIRAVNDLVERGLLERVARHRDNGSQSSNTYRLTFLPAGAIRSGAKKSQRGGVTVTPQGPAVTPVGVTVAPLELPLNSHITKTPPTPPTPTRDGTPLATKDDGGKADKSEDELNHAIHIAERRRATRNAGSLLGQQHPRVWAAFTDLQAIYSWKPAQFAAIAEQLLTLAREHTDERVEAACRAVIEAGATISHPIAYARKLLTPDNPTLNPTTTGSRLDGLPDVTTWTLD